jgi:acyl-CoA hydrolase
MVALDENDNPAPVPKLIPDTDEEKAEFEAGKKRSELRKARRAENF